MYDGTRGRCSHGGFWVSPPLHNRGYATDRVTHIIYMYIVTMLYPYIYQKFVVPCTKDERRVGGMTSESGRYNMFAMDTVELFVFP